VLDYCVGSDLSKGDVELPAMTSGIAIVRGVPDSFCDALSMTPSPQPVNLAKARLQHEAYVNVLKGTVLSAIAGASTESAINSLSGSFLG